MSQNPENLDEIDLYRDPDSGKLVGRDPDTGDTFPIPIESTKQDEIQIDEKATMSKDDGTVGDLAQYDGSGGIEIGDSTGVNKEMKFYIEGLLAGLFTQDTNSDTYLDLNQNEIRSLGAIKFRSNNDRVMYGANSGLTILRSFGTDATILDVRSPPNGSESTLALVQGDYVHDIYNNTGYTTGNRANQLGISLKSNDGKSPAPFVIDFDDNGSYVPRFKLNPSGSTEIKNGDVELDQGDGLILKSPDGTNYRVKVQDDGSLTTETI